MIALPEKNLFHKTKISDRQKPRVMNGNNGLHVALIYGGLFTEREVSLLSFKGLNDGLLELGYQVTPVDVGVDFIEVMSQLRPDIVFNGLYGKHGEDGYIPAILDMLGLKYTHSGLVASAIAFNKVSTYKAFECAGIKVPEQYIVFRKDNLKSDPMPRPYVIKPISEGSSIGVHLIFTEDDFNFASYDWRYGDEIIVQRYIPGRELAVAVFGNKAVGIIELVPLKNRFYDYQSKYTDGFTKHIMPAPLASEVERELLDQAERAHKAVGAKTVSRVDFLYNPQDGVNILEINTHPGMTPFSLVPEICRCYGITFNEILDRLIKDALT